MDKQESHEKEDWRQCTADEEVVPFRDMTVFVTADEDIVKSVSEMGMGSYIAGGGGGGGGG